jgi:hypothetical protein
MSDQTKDRNGQGIHRILQLYSAPDYVKQASQADIYGEDLSPHMFADAVRRRFPCHTAPATWVSAAFFAEKKAEYSPSEAERIQRSLQHSADYFQIVPDTEELQTKIAQSLTHDESELPDDAFALVMNFENGEKHRKYPMRNPGEVKTAAAYLSRYRDHFVFSDRRKIADKILTKASEFGADIHEHRDMLEKTSGVGVCSANEASQMLRSRVRALGNIHQPTKLQQELTKLADVVEGNPAGLQHHSTLTKIAEMVDHFDRDNGLVKHYGQHVERPEDVLFGITEKIASETANDIIGNNLTGTFFKKADLARVPISAIEDSMGDDFAREVSTANAWVDTDKLAQIVPTLPRGDAELFESTVIEAGCKPFATKAATDAKQIPPQDLVAMAGVHLGNPGSLWSHIR